MRHENNFDLIRLIAALSVFCQHLVGYGLINNNTWAAAVIMTFVQIFPGVPVFFIISGYLISHSWAKNPNWKTYMKSRILRIYPALMISTFITSIILYSLNYFNWSWFINQLSIFWLYSTPQVSVPFSGGMPNQPLWSIPVEVKFYLIVPFISLLGVPGILLSMASSFILHSFYDFGIHHHPDLRHGIAHHFWFFGCGWLARVYWHRVMTWLDVPGWGIAHFTVCCFLVMLMPAGMLLGGLALTYNPPQTLFMAITLPLFVLSMAYTKPKLSQNLLKSNDVSYGIYIYHSAYLHLFKILITGSALAAICLTLVSTLITAICSWLYVEKPALKFKDN